MQTRLSTIDRMMRYVSPEPNNGCWLWTGSLHSGGYGQVWVNGGPKLAHRAVYEEVVGQIPDGLELDHLCRVRCCVNPNHLEPVTPRVNLSRCSAISTINSLKTHCDRGHEFTP